MEDRLVRVVHTDARLKRSRAVMPSSSSLPSLIIANACCTAKTSSLNSFSVTPALPAAFVIKDERDIPAQRLAIRSAVVGGAIGFLNHTTEETGRFFRLGDGEAFCNLCDRGGEWRLSKAGTRRKDLSDVGVAGFSDGAAAKVLVTDGGECGEDVTLYLGGDITVIWSAKSPTKGDGLEEVVHTLPTGGMRGIADEGLGMVKVSMTGLEGPMT